MQTRPAAIHKRHFESVKLPGIECTLHKGQKLNNLSKWKVGGEYRLLGEYLNSFFHGKNYTEVWPIYSLDIESHLLSFANSKSGFRGQWIIGSQLSENICFVLWWRSDVTPIPHTHTSTFATGGLLKEGSAQGSEGKSMVWKMARATFSPPKEKQK